MPAALHDQPLGLQLEGLPYFRPAASSGIDSFAVLLEILTEQKVEVLLQKSPTAQPEPFEPDEE